MQNRGGWAALRALALPRAAWSLLRCLLAFACWLGGATAPGVAAPLWPASPSGIASPCPPTDFDGDRSPDRFTDEALSPIQTIRLDLSGGGHVRFVLGAAPTGRRFRLFPRDVDRDGDADLIALLSSDGKAALALSPSPAPAAMLWLNDGRGAFHKAPGPTLLPGGGSAADAAEDTGCCPSLVPTGSPRADEYAPIRGPFDGGSACPVRAPFRTQDAASPAPYWVLPYHTPSPLSRRGPPARVPSPSSPFSA